MKKLRVARLVLAILLVIVLVAPTIPAGASNTTLSINAGATVRPFNSKMRGTNVGIWANSGYYPTLNSKLLNVIKEAGFRMLRYPAGHEADEAYWDRTNYYDWHNNGSKKPPAPYTRTLRADYLDAFISMCKQIGAEPMIIVNTKTDDADMAADIVRYCNVEKGYNVKYFEIGNEPQYWGGVTVEQYSERLSRYVTAMKAIDSKIIISSSAGPQPSVIDTWLKPVLQTQGSKVNAVTIHWYPMHDKLYDNPTHPQSPSIPHMLYYDYGVNGHQNASIKYAERFVKTNSNSLVNLRNQYSPGAEIGMTELAPVAGGDTISGVSDTLAGALWYGDILGRLAYNGVDFVTQFLLQSEPQKYALVDYSYNIRPAWYTYVMYKRYFGDTMVSSSSSDDGNLTVWASRKTGESDKLYVMIINKSASTNITANINFTNFTPTSSTANKWVLSGTSLESLTANINGVTAASDCSLPYISPQSVTGVNTNFSHTFNARSVTNIVFTGNFGTAPTPTPTPTPVPSTAELLQNPGFESGTTSWTAVGGSIALDSTIKNSGSYSLKSTGRAATYHGMSQDITQVLLNNGHGTYDLSAFVRLGSGSDTVRPTLKIVTSNGTVYYSVNGTANSTGFTKISGSQNVTWSGTLQSASYYIQTATSLTDIYADDCSLKKQYANILNNSDFTNGTTSWSGLGCTLSTEGTIVRSAPYSLKATGRVAKYHGPSQDIKTALLSCGQGTYNLSAWARLASGTDSAKITIKLVSDSGTSYFGSALQSVNNSNFNQITGSVNLTWTGTLQSASFYVETNSSLTDIFIDDCNMIRQ